MIRSVAAKLTWVLTGTLVGVAVSGCGLKGDLYLPESEPAAATGQNLSADKPDAAKAITTAPNGAAAAAADEDKPKVVSKPPESASPQP